MSALQQMLVGAGGGAALDPYFAYVSLLLHMDGTNGSTTFTDNSPVPKTASLIGSPTVNTSVVKYGTGSLYSNTNGSLGFSNPEFNLGTADFTIEAWIYTISFGGEQNICATATNATPSGTWYFSISSSGRLQFGGYSVGGALIGVTAFATNTWHHVALCRSGTTLRIFLNGVQDAVKTSFTANLIASGGTGFAVGSWYDGIYKFYGYIDDVRITKGIARYTANFTPPTGPFPNS